MARSFWQKKIGTRGVQPVHQALKTYQQAQNYFEQVTNPDLVDFAIYDMEAARKRYIYLLKMAQKGQEAITCEELPRQEAE